MEFKKCNLLAVTRNGDELLLRNVYVPKGAVNDKKLLKEVAEDELNSLHSVEVINDFINH